MRTRKTIERLEKQGAVTIKPAGFVLTQELKHNPAHVAVIQNPVFLVGVGPIVRPTAEEVRRIMLEKLGLI
jgi:hypothetical protein